MICFWSLHLMIFELSFEFRILAEFRSIILRLCFRWFPVALQREHQKLQNLWKLMLWKRIIVEVSFFNFTFFFTWELFNAVLCSSFKHWTGTGIATEGDELSEMYLFNFTFLQVHIGSVGWFGWFSGRKKGEFYKYIFY